MKSERFVKLTKSLQNVGKLKKTRIRTKDTFSIEDIFGLIEQKEISKQQSDKKLSEGRISKAKLTILRYYRQYGKNKYNVRICQKVEETLNEDNDIKSN